METNNRAIENFNELIFENKHKEYGAYAIRKSYTDTVTRSLIITSLFFGMLAITAIYLTKGKEPKPDISGNTTQIDSVIIIEVDNTPPEKIIEPIPEKKTENVLPKTDNLNLQASDKIVETDVKPNELAQVVAGGDVNGSDSAQISDKPDVTFVKKLETNNDPVYEAEEKPEFYGNVYQFIKDRLKYPQVAKENGTQGVVGLAFVIEKDGSVDNIKILNAVGDGCTEEAIRVLKSMPKWKPGKIKGEPVRVHFTLPVYFRLK